MLTMHPTAQTQPQTQPMKTQRYRARWNKGSVDIHDTRFNNAVFGTIFFHKTVDGNGWRFISRCCNVGNSRVLHASPHAVIKSMRLMTAEQARTDLAEMDSVAMEKMAETTIKLKIKR